MQNKSKIVESFLWLKHNNTKQEDHMGPNSVKLKVGDIIVVRLLENMPLDTVHT